LYQSPDGEDSEFFSKHYYYIIVPSLLHLAPVISNCSDAVVDLLLQILTLFSTYSKEGFPLFKTLDQTKFILKMLQDLLPRRFVKVVSTFAALVPLLMNPIPMTEVGLPHSFFGQIMVQPKFWVKI